MSEDKGFGENDTLDKFKKEYQAKYSIKEFNNPYERMNDNYHFRSSAFGDYSIPEKRSTLKPREIKALYLGPEKANKYASDIIVNLLRSSLTSSPEKQPTEISSRNEQRGYEEKPKTYEQMKYERQTNDD
jgi:hypothetical protein